MKDYLDRWRLRRKYSQCHDIALSITSMGYNNLCQYDLDTAKDSLYSAALSFKSELIKLKREK